MSQVDPRLETLQRRIGYRFARPELLSRAITHRSFGADHNERLEFLGDAVLSLAVSSLLFERFAGSDEGDLTRVRAHLVREDSLHRVALMLGLPEMLRLSEGEARGGGIHRLSHLRDFPPFRSGCWNLSMASAPRGNRRRWRRTWA